MAVKRSTLISLSVFTVTAVAVIAVGESRNVNAPQRRTTTAAATGIEERADLTQPDPQRADADTAEETTHRPATDVAERYRGFVVHNQLPDKQIPLELSVFGRGDSATTGWLVSGAPLDTRGLTWLIESGDSLYLVTHGVADTIVWASETRTGRIGGEFWVNAGPNAGKGGTWQLEPAPRLSVATLSLVTVLLAGGMLLGIFAVAAFGAERWWRWRATQPLDVPSEKRAQLTGVGGWLVLVIIGQVVVAVTQLIRIGEVGGALGETWMLGAALPGMRPLLLLESAVHVFQMAAIVGGVLLIVRKSRMAPPYWQAFLAIMFTYAVLDIAATASLSDDMIAIFGADAAAEFDTETARARRLNVRLAFWAAVWTLYWMRSRRVALTFRPAEAAPLPDAAVATDYRLPDPAGHEHVKP